MRQFEMESEMQLNFEDRIDLIEETEHYAGVERLHRIAEETVLSILIDKLREKTD